ncbi:hypothetical protein [Aliivibrio salmonicida]|uniref:hypothetical protein n=1 Tax=Aliivibrio salmonicida TaxID=40269 RepID=UPI003D107546
MALIKNTAKERSINDEGLSVSTDSYIHKCISIGRLEWKDAKSKIDDMDVHELGKFASVGRDLNLPKNGAISIRLSISEYAALLVQAKRNETSISTCIINNAIQ